MLQVYQIGQQRKYVAQHWKNTLKMREHVMSLLKSEDHSQWFLSSLSNNSKMEI